MCDFLKELELAGASGVPVGPAEKKLKVIYDERAGLLLVTPEAERTPIHESAALVLWRWDE